MITLGEAILQMEAADDDAVLCARMPFSPASEAVIGRYTEDFGVPDAIGQQGFDYVLGKDEVVELLEQVRTRRADRDQQVAFVLHYATFDAYPDWFEDLPEH